VESGLAAALPEGEPVPMLARLDSAWLTQLKLTWDTFSNRWNQWVLGYGQERQYDFLSRLGLEMASWKELAVGLAVGVGALLLVFSIFMLRRSKTGTSDPAAVLYRRFCSKLARAGIVRKPGEGPLDFSRRVVERRPDLAARVNTISKLYVALRYQPHPRPAWLQRLKELVRSFKA